MKTYLSLFSLTILALSLTACLHNRTDDYVNAQNNPPLKTPPGVQNPTFKDNYPIPQKSTNQVVAAPSLVPPGLTTDEDASTAVLAEEKKTNDN